MEGCRVHAIVCLQVTDLSPNNDDEALCVGVSSDGRWVATGGTAQRLKLWEAKTMQLVASEQVGGWWLLGWRGGGWGRKV